MLKAKDSYSQTIRAALIGSSRVLSGIGRGDAEEILGERTYNCGISGAKFEESYEYAKLLIKNQPQLNALIVGIDFFGFNEYYPFESEYRQSRIHKRAFYIPDWISFAYSLKALKDSAKFLMGILPPSMQMDEMGYLTGIKDGQITTKEREEFERGLIKRYYGDNTPNVYQKYKISKSALHAFEKLVDLCKKKDIRLYVYLTPAHMVYWEALFLKGYWPILEEWKRTLVQIHPIWDFSSENEIITSPFLKEYGLWFYDMNHARPCVGRKILNQMIHLKEACFGVLLMPETVETNLMQIKNNLQTWSAHHSEAVQWLHENGNFSWTKKASDL